MPYFPFTQLIAAGATALPLATWSYRFPPKLSLFELMVVATAAGVVMNLTTGAESIVQADSPVTAGGTAGVLPARLNNEPIVDMVNPGEELVLALRNTAGAGITVNGIAILTYK
jgi:hypothetical protein